MHKFSILLLFSTIFVSFVFVLKNRSKYLEILGQVEFEDRHVATYGLCSYIKMEREFK